MKSGHSRVTVQLSGRSRIGQFESNLERDRRNSARPQDPVRFEQAYAVGGSHQRVYHLSTPVWVW